MTPVSHIAACAAYTDLRTINWHYWPIFDQTTQIRLAKTVIARLNDFDCLPKHKTQKLGLE